MTTNSPEVAQGSCRVVLLYNIAGGIDLTAAAKLPWGAQREQLDNDRRIPADFGIDPAPLRKRRALNVESLKTLGVSPEVEISCYAFGVIEFIVRIDLKGKQLDKLPSLADKIFKSPKLTQWGADQARKIAQELADSLVDPVESDSPDARSNEDAIFWSIQKLVPRITPEQGLESAGFATSEEWLKVVEENAMCFAQMLLGETKNLSLDRLVAVLKATQRISYYETDLVITNFNGALIFGDEDPDVSDVIALLNAKLLEIRALDEKLDEDLKYVSPLIEDPSKAREQFDRALHRYADGILRFGAVDSAINLSGDQYLAELASQVSTDLGLPDFTTHVEKKLTKLRGLIETISNRDQLEGQTKETKRTNVLDFLIVVLIIISIVLPFFVKY